MKNDFPQQIKNLTERLNKIKLSLLFTSFFLTLGLILANNLDFLPLEKGDSVFLFCILLAAALYRPGWAFLFFVSFIFLENINLLPAEWGIKLRPYQILTIVIASAVIIRWATKRLNFHLLKPHWYDFLIISLGAFSLLSALFSQHQAASLKLTVVLFSFILIYLLARNFLTSKEDICRILPFAILSSIVIALYGIWQNIRFQQGLTSWEIMPGRPNATFPEADWLGMSLVIATSLALALVYYFRKNKFLFSSYFILHTLYFTLLIITVSRSAWLGVAASTFAFLFIILTQLKFNPKEWQWKAFFEISSGVLISAILAIGTVYFFHLTNFQLFNRATSTASGLQKITVACNENKALPAKIADTQELENYHCYHINLEDIDQEKQKGKIIQEVFRDDPNVNVRAQIYQKSWQTIKQHPIMGIGWGSIGEMLGQDERGASLNASNIFLELWLGTGLLGLLSFLIIWLFILGRAIKNFFQENDFSAKLFWLTIITIWIGLTISNLFNSGIMLGFLWLFLATALIKNKDLHQTK